MTLNFFKAIVDGITLVVKGIKKVNFATMLVDVLMYIPQLVKEFQTLLDLRKDGITPEEAKQLVDDGLSAFDEATGTDEQGNKKLSMIKGMPIDKQEETLDALKVVIRNLMYNKAKVEGYYE